MLLSLRRSQLFLRRTDRHKTARTHSTRLYVTMATKPITLYTAGTPNGWKASITVEELEIPYELKAISLSKLEQKEDWFLKINPNGRIPAIVDHEAGDLPVFESGAIMWYLASTKDKQHKLWPEDVKGQAEVMSWLMFQMGGLGPMQGQANHFNRYAPERIEYGIKRYTAETDRLYQVLEERLKDHEWLAAGRYTIADIANFSWVLAHDWAGVSLDDKPNLRKWVERIESRPAVKRGLDVPEPNKIVAASKDPELAKKMIEDAKNIMVKHKD